MTEDQIESRRALAREKIQQVRHFIRRIWLGMWLAAAVLVVISLFVVVSDYRMTMRAVDLRVALAADGAAQSLRFVMQGIHNELESVAAFMQGRERRLSLKDMLTYQKERVGVGHMLFVLNPFGRVIATSDPDLLVPGYSFADEDFFKAHRASLETGLYVGAPVRGWGMPLSVAILDARQKVIGVVAAFVNEPGLVPLLPPEWGRQHGIQVLIRYDDAVLAAVPPSAEWMHPELIQSAGAVPGKGSGVRWMRWGAERSSYLVAFRRLSPWPLMVEAGVSFSNAFGSFRERALIWTFLTVLVIGGMMAGVMIHLRELRRRLLQAEVIARKNEDLRRVSGTQTEFLAHMSHELRTPLNAVIGFAEALEAEVHGPLVGKQKEYANDIAVAGRHLLGLVNDLLDLSVIDSGGMKLNESEVDVVEVVRAALKIVQPFVNEARQTLVVEAEKGLPIVRVDARKIEQVLLNLLGNAVKFTPPGGTIRIVLRLAEPEGLVMAVSDTGSGIAEKDIPLVLSPFGRVQSASSQTPEGVGIGLPLSRRLVELHGGRLTIESREGQGTTVSVWLPAGRFMAPSSGLESMR